MRSSAFTVCLLSLTGCTPPAAAPAAAPAATPAPTIDQSKFEPLYRSGKAIEGALNSGVSMVTFSELLQSLATEIAIANDKTLRQDERSMVDRFEEAHQLFAKSRDGWRDDGPEEAQRLRVPATPRLQSAVRLYFSDSAGAKAAFDASLKAVETVTASRNAKAAALEREVVAMRGSARRRERVEILAGTLTNSDLQARLSACRELTKMVKADKAMVTAASGYRYNIKGVSEGDSDPQMRACAAELFLAFQE